jgi:hypothetical protein
MVRLIKMATNSFRLVFALLTIFVGVSALGAEAKIYRGGLALAEFNQPLTIRDVRGEPVKPDIGMRVMPGSRVQTGVGALCVLTDPTGDQVSLDANSELSILMPELKNLDRSASLALNQGRAQFQAKPGLAQQMRVRTAVSMLTVRGTNFSVAYVKDIFRLQVLEGIVEAEFFDDPTQVVPVSQSKMLDMRQGVKRSGVMGEEKKQQMKRVKEKAASASNKLSKSGLLKQDDQSKSKD